MSSAIYPITEDITFVVGLTGFEESIAVSGFSSAYVALRVLLRVLGGLRKEKMVYELVITDYKFYLCSALWRFSVDELSRVFSEAS